MFYVDCNCSTEHWKEFLKQETAETYFNTLKCKSKILYDENFKTIKEQKE